MLFIVVGLTAAAVVPALSQGTAPSGQLERVDVEPPVPTQSIRANTLRSGADYEQAPSSDLPASEDFARVGQRFWGAGIPESTSSLVTEKPQVSIGSGSMPAQVSVVTGEAIQRLNVTNLSDVFRQVPGLNTNWYGQGDVGFAFGMRGFVGQHGKDTATFVDGVPQNFPSAAQGSTGMVNLAWLTPEVIERIEIIRGPVSALYGDHALAGAVNIVTKKSQASPSFSARGGSFGYARGLGVISTEFLSPTPYVVNELYTIDGYRDNSQQKKWNMFNKISVPVLRGLFSLRFNYSTSEWGAPSYLSIDKVKQGLVNRTDAVNSSDGGDARRYEVAMNYAPLAGERGLYATFYWGHYDLLRYGSNTFPQSAQMDDRDYWGGRVFYNMVFGDVADLKVGVESRQDSGQALQFNSVRRKRYNTKYDYGLRLASYSWFLQSQIKAADSLKIVGGVRGDYFRLQVDNATNPANSGIGYPGHVSPKIGVVLTPTKNFNVFGNVATGLRSPAAVELSPSSLTRDKDFNLPPARITTCDVGFNATVFDNLYLAADYYHTIMEREVQTINNQQLAIGDTTRKGFELEAKFYASNQINVFANYGWVDAEVQNPVRAGQHLIILVPEHIIKGGVQMTRDFGAGRRLLADLYYQYYSGAPLYLGATTVVPTYGPDYDEYNIKLTYEGTGWSANGTGKYQPREYSSQFIGPFNGTLSFDPQPTWSFSSELAYTF